MNGHDHVDMCCIVIGNIFGWGNCGNVLHKPKLISLKNHNYSFYLQINDMFYCGKNSGKFVITLKNLYLFIQIYVMCIVCSFWLLTDTICFNVFL